MNNNEDGSTNATGEEYDPSYVNDRKEGDDEQDYGALDPDRIVEDSAGDENNTANNAANHGTNNERRNTLGISSSRRKQCRDSYYKFTSGHTSITTGVGENIPTFSQVVIASVDEVRNWCRRGFNNLEPKFQCWLANTKPAQPCLLWDLEAVMNHFRLTSPEQIDSLAVEEIIRSGIPPLIKTPTKAFGPWSLRSRFGGDHRQHDKINMGTPIRLRYSTAFALMLDPSWPTPYDDYGTVPLDLNGDDRLEELKRKAKALNQAAMETFIIHDATDGTFLKRVEGTHPLFDVVGGSKRFGDDATTETVRQAIKEAGGRFFHRESAKGVYAYFISVAEEDSPTTPSAEAEQRLQEIQSLVGAYDGKGRKPEEFWTFSIYRERNNGEMVESGVGKRELIRAMNEEKSISLTSMKYQRGWSDAPDGEKIGEILGESMWRANAVGGWLFNQSAELWIKLDYDEEEVV